VRTVNKKEYEAEQDGWQRTMELRWLISPTPGEGPTLQQKWTRLVHGYGEDFEEDLWIDIAAVSDD
jgi:hypothetical protein